MSNDTNTKKYSDVHTRATGFLFNARTVGTKGKSYLAVNFSQLYGEKPEPGSGEKQDSELVTFRVRGPAAALVEEHWDAINDKDAPVFVAVTYGDVKPELFIRSKDDPVRGKKKGDPDACLSGNLFRITYLSVKGEVVYKEERRNDQQPQQAAG